MSDEPLEPVDPASSEEVALGISLGHHQAFGWIAAKCSAIDAHTLKDLRDSQRYRRTGLNWPRFCKRYAGMSFRTADRIISRLHEFGDTYFNLTRILPITINEYRELQPDIDAGTLEFDGQQIPINQENSDRLQQAVADLRARLEKAKAEARRDPFAELEQDIDRSFGRLAGALRRCSQDADRDRLTALLDAIVRRAAALNQEL